MICHLKQTLHKEPMLRRKNDRAGAVHASTSSACSRSGHLFNEDSDNRLF